MSASWGCLCFGLRNKSQFIPGPSYFHILLQLSLFLIFGEMRTISYLAAEIHLGAADWTTKRVPARMNIQYMFMQIWFHGTAEMTEYIQKIAYQSVLKCNACAPNEICMTNWLQSTQSRQVLWTFAQKLIEIPFIMTVALQRTREWEGRTERDEYNDFWLQKQGKLCTMYRNIITNNYAISQLKKVNKNTGDEHIVILFTNVTVCLNAIQYYIFFTRKPACVCKWKLQTSAIQADGFK